MPLPKQHWHYLTDDRKVDAVHDKISLNILSFFLLIVALLLPAYLLELRKKNSPNEKAISANAFLLVSFGILALNGTFLLFLGFGNFLLASALALGIGLSLLHPAVATSFFAAVLFTRPWESISNNSFLELLPRLMALLAFASWVLYSLRNRRLVFAWNLPCCLFVCLFVWLFLCCLMSSSMNDSLTFFIDNFVRILAVSFLVLNTILTRQDFKLFSRTLVLSILGVISVALYKTIRDYSSDPMSFRLHSDGLWGNANDLAALLVVILPLALTPFFQKERGGSALLKATLISLFVFVALLWTQSRGATLAVLASGISYIIFCRFNKKLLVVASILIISVPLILYFMPQRDEQDLSGSSSSRSNYLIAGLRMAKDSPIFGVGVNNYSRLYEQYTPAFVEWGARTAHSTWVLFLAEAGLIGLLLFISLYLSVLKSSWKLRKDHPQFFLILVAYGVAMSFLSHSYLFLPYVIFAYVLVAARIYSSNEVLIKQVLTSAPTPTRSMHRKVSALGSLAACLFFLLATDLRAQEIKLLEAVSGIDKPIGNYMPISSEKLNLKGSRAEILAFMIKMAGTGCGDLSINIPDSAKLDLKVNLYSLPYVETEHPSFLGASVGKHLDPALLWDSPSICMEPNLKERWFLAEINLGKNLKPDHYNLNIAVGDKSIDLSVDVWSMTIPDQPVLPAYSELTTWFALLGHYGKWHESEAELGLQYIAEMNAHRIYPLKSSLATPEIIVDESGPRLDISSKPSPQSSFTSVVLNPRPAWAYYDFPTVGSSGFEKIDYTKAQTYFRAIENTIPAINRPGKALVYLWDEPQANAISELVKLSGVVKKTAPTLKQLVTTTYLPHLAKSVDIFAPVIDQFDANGFPKPDIYKGFQKEGKEVWWYVSCMSHGCEALADSKVPDMVIDRSASYVRSIGWLSMKYELDAFLYYSVNNGYQHYPKRDPWKSLWDFSGNGDGTLFYPGRPGEHGLNQHTAVPSLRLKLWRESSYDAEYINWMQKLEVKPLWWKTEYATLVQSTTNWSHDYSKYLQLRNKAGDFLHKFQGGK